jgi:hypothetical protein
MTTNDRQPNIAETVLAKIKNREVTATPKSYFVLRLVGLIAVVVALFVVSIFFASFMVFTFRTGGHMTLAHFGVSGWEAIALLFPWKLFALELLLIGNVEWLLRSFSFGYRIPSAYLLGAVLLVMGLTGVAVDQTPLHDSLLQRADMDDLPILGEFYEHVRIPPPEGHGIYRGEIIAASSTLLTIAIDNPRGFGTTTLIGVLVPKGSETIPVGTKVFVYGEERDGTIYAKDIRIATGVPETWHDDRNDNDADDDH